MAPPRVRSTFVPSSRPRPVNINQTMNQPMNPGMSLAMAGNTGLAGISENQANQIKQAQQAINRFQDQFTGNTTEPVTFKSIGQRFGERGSEYRRPADKLKFANQMEMINKGIGAGGNFFVGPDGIPRFSFTNTGVKTPDGSTLLSMQLPQISAIAPTLNQIGGDIGRAFSGFDSIRYADPNMQGPMPSGQSRDMPFMQRTPGMFDNFKPLPLRLLEGVGSFFKDAGQGGDDFNRRLMELTTAQRREYDKQILIPGTTREQAYNKAIGMAMGGIATLQ